MMNSTEGMVLIILSRCPNSWNICLEISMLKDQKNSRKILLRLAGYFQELNKDGNQVKGKGKGRGKNTAKN